MNAVVDHSVVLKDVRGTLAADTLEDSGGGDFVIGEERVKASTSSCIGVPYVGEEMF